MLLINIGLAVDYSVIATVFHDRFIDPSVAGQPELGMTGLSIFKISVVLRSSQ
jgi:hypothetical protein